jgi:hypothetical protein
MILGMNKIGVVLLIHNPNMNQIVPICDKMNLRWEIKARDNKEGKKS